MTRRTTSADRAAASRRRGVVAVIRLADGGRRRDVARARWRTAACTAIEVTMTVPRAVELIERTGRDRCRQT